MSVNACCHTAEYIETRLSEMTVTQNVSESLKGVPKKLWIVNSLPPEMITIPSKSIAPQDPFLFPFVTNCIHIWQYPPE